ncbi:hypothetical protein CC1G_08895 [Coprinopsis cinerea okayama7|uniref:Uncharacterized protein n=1 Tax=Coprinopsis cinerea (strain Okayama-7 / 130 / ATCC MYA-4618 / FGSC 9003) TaxID=240176 RepID=A8P881_COPC7|nr:hypothetical protein CC1G_08895 [Coprinopsis cinerea okayama7\|eukprot:XP_001839516.1 hypothetical protein CC1G_08895 [Coprinopsis cinerea okayama7\
MNGSHSRGNFDAPSVAHDHCDKGQVSLDEHSFLELEASSKDLTESLPPAYAEDPIHFPDDSPLFFYPFMAGASPNSPIPPSAARLPAIPYFDGPHLDLPDDCDVLSPSPASTPWMNEESGSFNHYDVSFNSDSTTSSADTTFDMSQGPFTPSHSRAEFPSPFPTHLNARFHGSAKRGLGLGIMHAAKKEGFGQFPELETLSIQSSDESYSRFSEGISGADNMTMMSPASSAHGTFGPAIPERFFYPIEGGGEEEEDVADSSLLTALFHEPLLSLGTNEDGGYGRALSSIPECDSWYEIDEARVADMEVLPLISSSDEGGIDDEPSSTSSSSTSAKRSKKFPGDLKRTSSLPKSASHRFLMSARHAFSSKARSAPTSPKSSTSNLGVFEGAQGRV